jgi:molecular chaperone GrpE
LISSRTIEIEPGAILDSRKIPINAGSPASSRSDTPGDTAQFRVVDRRPFAGMEEGALPSGPVEVKPRYPTYVEELMAKVADTESRFAERVKQIDQEIVRSKTRLELEYERRLSLAKQELLLPFLDVLDNLERAIRAAGDGGNSGDLLQGLRLTADLFRARLKSAAVEPIPVVNQPFDPNFSEAIGVVPVSDPLHDGWVVDELLPGYRMGENLLRPARVRVGRYQPPASRSGD